MKTKFYEWVAAPMWSGWILDVGERMKKRDYLRKITQRKPKSL